MSANRDDGGPAFPRNPGSAGTDVGSETWLRDTGLMQDGMTLRDWFAGQALAALVANPKTNADATNAHLATVAYGLADALLTERAKMERGQAPDSPAAGVGKGLPAMPAPVSDPHCRNCGLILDSDRPYCLVCDARMERDS